jgi:hypothetical protein
MLCVRGADMKHCSLGHELKLPRQFMGKKNTMISFRKINSPESFQRLLDFLKADVQKHGGSASEVVDMHGTLRDITVSDSPWGLVVINEETTQLEALAKLFNTE